MLKQCCRVTTYYYFICGKPQHSFGLKIQPHCVLRVVTKHVLVVALSPVVVVDNTLPAAAAAARPFV